VIPLAASPAPGAFSPYLVDAGGTQRGALGADLQRINRMGTRFGATVPMPPCDAAAEGRVLVSRLVRGTQEGLRLALPLLGFEPGSTGLIVVDGAGQAGSTLAIKDATPGYAFKEGQWFNHFDGERYKLYQLAGDMEADGSGQAELPIFPMLRAEPGDEDLLVFGAPVIEGLVVDERPSWEASLAHHIALTFTLEEVA
jgi:hypothetical protein